jgi:hypothetical protein
MRYFRALTLLRLLGIGLASALAIDPAWSQGRDMPSQANAERIATPPANPIRLSEWSFPEVIGSANRPGGTATLAGARLLATSHLLDGEPVSAGTNWKALYDSQGVTFVPLLGKRAPSTRRLHFRLTSVDVGADSLPGLDLAAAPRLNGSAVEYPRGAGVTEYYLAKQEGLEQCFRLESLPHRDGDLVVRGQLSTDLVALDGRAAAPALRFEEPGFASVHVSTAVAIDARGERVHGSLRRDQDAFEIRIPEAFLASAELPLIVDPLFGVTYPATNDTQSCEQPDVAFGDSSKDEYSITFVRYFSASDPDINAATFNSQSGAIGVPFFQIEAVVGTFDQEPAIAYTAASDQFIVAWQRSAISTAQSDIFVAKFPALTSGVGITTLTLASGSTDQKHADIGAEADTIDARAVVVYADAGKIRVASLEAPFTGPISIKSNVPIPTMGSGSQDWPTITKSGGTLGFYLVAAEDDFITDRDLDFVVVNYLGSVMSNGMSITSVGPDEERPDAGDYLQASIFDPLEFMTVFQRQAAANDGDNSIIARKLRFTSNVLTIDPQEVLVAATLDVNEIEPAIGLAGHEYLIAWSAEKSQFLNGFNVLARSVDPDLCAVCEPTMLAGSGGIFNSCLAPEIGSRQAGGDSGASAQEAAIAFELEQSGPDQIQFHFWESDGSGSVSADQGGGCGGGGVLVLQGATTIGSQDFVAGVVGADPAATLGILNLGVPGGAIPCGTCNVLPLQTLVNVGLSQGVGAKLLKIPCKGTLAGQTLALQWIVLPTLSTPCPLVANLSFSNTVHLTLGF